MAFTATTVNSAAAWRPDIYEFAPADVIPEALLLQLSTIGSDVEGDQPSVHVGYVDDASAVFKAEGAALDEAQPALNEALIHTAKLTQLIRLSTEQYRQASTPDQLALSVNRAIVRGADAAFLSQPAPTGPAVAPMAGLINVSGIVSAAASIATNLDPLSDLIATIENNLSTPTAVVVDPLGWSQLRKLKVGTAYNSTLLGSGTEDTQPLLFSLPVFINRFMSSYTGLVIDKSAVVSAVGSVLVATSEHQYFTNDSVALRCTWRFGHVVVRPTRIGKFSITPPGS